MPISVLIVEDDAEKLGRIHNVVLDSGVDAGRIKHAVNAATALEILGTERFDLMLLDINLPRRYGEAARRGGGMDVLKEIHRGGALHRPRYVAGVTAYEDAISEFGDSFADQLWTLVHYQDTSDRWMEQIKSKIAYVDAIRTSDNFTDGRTYGYDVAVVCALDTVELAAMRNLPCGWQPLRLPHDETRYWNGVIHSGKRTYSIVVGAAPRMGMPSSAVLSAKMIASFRPRILAMTGICAGRFGKVNLGDVIVANPSWDWGSGKLDSVDDKPRFRPSPHHINVDIDLINELKEIADDVGLMARIKQEASGKKPPTELKAHFGPLASGAAVVADANVFESLLDHNRDLLGIEMEAYGLACAAEGCGKPRPKAIMMKSVCDFADKDKADDFQEYAAETSARFLLAAAPLILASL